MIRQKGDFLLSFQKLCNDAGDQAGVRENGVDDVVTVNMAQCQQSRRV